MSVHTCVQDILIAQEAMKGTTASDVEMGDHYGLENRYLIGHCAKMNGKWPMATLFLTLNIAVIIRPTLQAYTVKQTIF